MIRNPNPVLDALVSRSRILVAAVIAMTSILVVGQASGFPDFSRPYSHSGSGCSDSVDPVGVFFEGSEANAVHVKDQVELHAEWFDGSGSAQNLEVRAGASSYPCSALDQQRANGSSTESRNHVRLWRAPYYTGSTRKVVGTPHHEDFVFPCGHAVDSNGPSGSGFDQGRARLRNEFDEEGHATDGRNFGNTRNFQQCDGDWAGSNGGGVRIAMFH